MLDQLPARCPGFASYLFHPLPMWGIPCFKASRCFWIGKESLANSPAGIFSRPSHFSKTTLTHSPGICQDGNAGCHSDRLQQSSRTAPGSRNHLAPVSPLAPKSNRPSCYADEGRFLLLHTYRSPTIAPTPVYGPEIAIVPQVALEEFDRSWIEPLEASGCYGSLVG